MGVKYILIQRVDGLLILGAHVITQIGGLSLFPLASTNRRKVRVASPILNTNPQKLIPLFVLSHVPSPLIFRLSVISWVAIPAIGLLSKTLKKIVILSSLFNLIIITDLRNFKKKVKGTTSNLCADNMPAYYFGKMPACSRWKAVGSMSKLTRLGLMMFFFVRIGLPPLPRFFMKVEVILAVITANSAFGAIFLGAGAGGMLILYLGLVVGASLSGPRILMRLHFTPKAPLYLSPIFLAGGLLL